jgi:hypothetical protein
MPADDVESQGKASDVNYPSILQLKVSQFRKFCRESERGTGQYLLTGSFGNSLERVRSFFLEMFAGNKMSALGLLFQENGTSTFQKHFYDATAAESLPDTDSSAMPHPLDVAAYGFIREEYRKRNSGYSAEEICRFMGAEPREMPDTLRQFARTYPRRFQK